MCTYLLLTFSIADCVQLLTEVLKYKSPIKAEGSCEGMVGFEG